MPPISCQWGNAIIEATYIPVNTVSCSFRAGARKMRNQRYSIIRGGFASRHAARLYESLIDLRSTYCLDCPIDCPIAFCSRPVHRPDIARRLSSWKSRRQSSIVSSFRPACRIDGRGVVWDGTADGTANGERTQSKGCSGKVDWVFDNFRQAIENASVTADAGTAYIPYRPRIEAGSCPVFRG